MTPVLNTLPSARPLTASPAAAPICEQPFQYPVRRDFIEPDWRRLPGFRDVSKAEWESARWQRRNSVKSIAGLKHVFGKYVPDSLLESVARDQAECASMPLLVTPQMLNTMNELALWSDPVRCYMLPAFHDRHAQWPTHPKASRDSLHETQMWAVEGLVHRYPTKVLTELIASCTQYCGHCTRMDLVGSDVPQVRKARFQTPKADRYKLMLEYIRVTPGLRDVVVSGGDISNIPVALLEDFVSSLLDIPKIKDIRLATKGLVAIPQHFLQGDVLRMLERLATKARQRGVDLAVHTQINCAQQVTPLVAKLSSALLNMGFRDVRNQGVLLRGVNASPRQLLELCFVLLDHARIMPYYFYVCDMVPFSEHWRTSIHETQQLQNDIMGYLPGFATPRLVCDVPLAGKRWIHQAHAYDRQLGISYWTKNFRTNIEANDPEALSRNYVFYDPIHTLPEAGQAWWAEQRLKSGSVSG
jgi:lysine 2,3-aminomutase